MPIYNFRKDTKLYIVYQGVKYDIDIYPDVSFSQTYNEVAVPQKTLHNQYGLFDDAVITKANPANFNFTIPLVEEIDVKIVLDLLVNYASNSANLNSCDIYIVSSNDSYKIEKCVFENGVFQIVRDKLVSLSISGTGSKISRYTGSAVPGTSFPKSLTKTYVIPNSLGVKLNNNILDSINSVSVEVQNTISWGSYDTVHAGINVTDYTNTMYPDTFVLTGRALSGSVNQHITDANSQTVGSWSTNSSLQIRIGNTSQDWLLNINIPKIVYTNRIDVEEIYLQSFDYRMNYNPYSLSDVIAHVATGRPIGSFSSIWAAI